MFNENLLLTFDSKTRTNYVIDPHQVREKPMTAETASKLANVQRYSASLKRLFQVLLVAVALAMCAKVFLIAIGDEVFSYLRIGLTEYRGESIPWAAHVISWVGNLLGLAILLKLFFHLQKLFGHYAEGRIFEKESVQQIRQIGVTVLLFPVLWLSLAIAPNFIPAEGRTALLESDGAGPFMELIAGAVILVVSWIMDVGREMREEQDLLV